MSVKAIKAIPSNQEANTEITYYHVTEATVQTAYDNLFTNGGILTLNGASTPVRKARLWHNAVLSDENECIGGSLQTIVYGNTEATENPLDPSDTSVYVYESTPIAADADYVLAAVTDNAAARDIYPVPDATHALSTLLPPSSAPTLTAVVGGSSLAAGFYQLAYSYVEGDTGQTMLSPRSTVTIVLNGSISVGALTLPPGVTAVNWFMSEAVGGTTLSMHQQKSTGAAFTITTLPIDFDFQDPDVCRNLTAVPGGTNTDVKAVSVIVWGTDYEDNPISETLPVFTVNALTAVTGSKAFKTVQRVQIPAHDGLGATTSVGVGSKLGLHHRLPRNTVIAAYLLDVKEATAPTVVVNAVDICKNVATLNTTLDGTRVNMSYIVPGLTFTE